MKTTKHSAERPASVPRDQNAAPSAAHGESAGERRLAQVRAPWLSGAIGLAVILVAFAVAVVNASLETPNKVISMTLQPFIFIGMGLLLFHIGLHVHAVHQNVILMASGMDTEPTNDRTSSPAKR
jgi:hypothetical protein